MQWSLLPSIRTRSASGCANVFWRTCFPSGTCASIVERSNKSITSTNPKNVECHLLSHSCPMNALKTSCSWRSVSPYPAPTTRRFLPLIEKYCPQAHTRFQETEEAKGVRFVPLPQTQGKLERRKRAKQMAVCP